MDVDFKFGFVGLFETIKLVFGERRNDRFRRRAGAYLLANISLPFTEDL